MAPFRLAAPVNQHAWYQTPGAETTEWSAAFISYTCETSLSHFHCSTLQTPTTSNAIKHQRRQRAVIHISLFNPKNKDQNYIKNQRESK